MSPKDILATAFHLLGIDPHTTVPDAQGLDSLKEHFTKRRKFLLEQDEIKKAGEFDRSLLQTGWGRPLESWLDGTDGHGRMKGLSMCVNGAKFYRAGL